MKKCIFLFFLLVSAFLFSTRVEAFGLNSLNASGTDLDLTSDKYEYNVTYNGTTGSVKIYASVKDGYSFKEGYGPRTVDLEYGDNQLLVIVVDENFEEETYTINIFRKDDRVDNNYLNNIVVNGKALKFDMEKQVYSFSVNNTVNNLNIKTSTNDIKAKYSIIGNDNLVYGNNEVKIIVTSESGMQRQYLLKVYRSSSSSAPMSSNTNLALLKIEGQDIDFDSTNYEYKVMVKEEAPLNIKAMAEDENATVKIVGNRSIKHNGIVEVRVIAEDGSQDIYKIKVGVEGMSNIDMATIGITVGAIVILISASIVIIHLVNGKKNREMMNFEVVKNEVSKMNIENEDDKRLMNFLLGGQGNVTNQNMNTNVSNNAFSNNANTVDNNYNDMNSINYCPYFGTKNSNSNITCINCGNSLGGKL